MKKWKWKLHMRLCKNWNEKDENTNGNYLLYGFHLLPEAETFYDTIATNNLDSSQTPIFTITWLIWNLNIWLERKRRIR